MKSFLKKKWLHIPIQPNQCNQCVYCINLVQDNVSLPYWVCASVCLSLYICLYFIFSIILLRWNMYNIYINCNSNSNHIKNRRLELPRYAVSLAMMNDTVRNNRNDKVIVISMVRFTKRVPSQNFHKERIMWVGPRNNTRPIISFNCRL